MNRFSIQPKATEFCSLWESCSNVPPSSSAAYGRVGSNSYTTNVADHPPTQSEVSLAITVPTITSKGSILPTAEATSSASAAVTATTAPASALKPYPPPPLLQPPSPPPLPSSPETPQTPQPPLQRGRETPQI
nr:polyadenylate-binding protein, cytoplasmic and nuclear-like isoform X3 [Ipomoea batatas]